MWRHRDVETQAEIPAIPPVTLAAVFANTEQLVGLCLQAKRNQFQRLPQTSPLHTRHVVYTGSVLFSLVNSYTI
jgi:hypothetical protein